METENEPSHDEIAKLAYKLWVEGGQQHGVEKDNWREAVKVLQQEQRHHRHHHDSEQIQSKSEGENMSGNYDEQNQDLVNQDEVTERNTEKRDEQEENATRQPADEDRNKGGSDNTEDKNPAGTDKSNQPPIGGSDETDEDSITRTQDVGSVDTLTSNNGDPTKTGVDNLQNKQ